MQLIWAQHDHIATGKRLATGMNRLRSLDGLRGIAAFGVVLWHWQHFYTLDGPHRDVWRMTAEPFSLLLRPFYVLGWAAVDIFFVLSGFVFFWLYAETIRTGAIGGLSFARLRFSRLYPLHFATLILVALLQLYFLRERGAFFIYRDNDWPHFIAQLFMVQNWWPRSMQSFNGPTWSVSIETMLYVIFFIACRFGLRRGAHCLFIALIGGLLLPTEEHIARGVIGFFLGGFVFTLWQQWRDSPAAGRIANTIGLAALSGWILLGLMTYYRLSWFANGEENYVFLVAFDFILAPLTVLALALREHVRGGAHPVFGFLGDISYAAYLLHFPMQLALALVAVHLGWGTVVFMQGWVLIAFFSVLTGLAAVTHYYFEKPLQRFIRGGGSMRCAAATA
jgi:peptidoglycan/LPS O-acetylase OafA/YrhL